MGYRDPLDAWAVLDALGFPLTHDDLLEFHELLRRDDWFQRLAAADEDGDLV